MPVVLAEQRRHLRSLRPRRVVSSLLRKPQVPLQALELVLLALQSSQVSSSFFLRSKEEKAHRFHPVDIKPRAIPLANHVGQFEVLRLDVPLHPLHPIDRLLSRVGLELHTLVLAEHLEVLVPELRIELGERFVLVAPERDLVLQRAHHLVLRVELRLDVAADVDEFAFESFNALRIQTPSAPPLLPTPTRQLTPSYRSSII
mgnify:CR=1 FL=1